MPKKRKKHNVLCVKHGDKYKQHHVDHLYKMIKKNTSYPFDFQCLSEDNFDFSDLSGHWTKMKLFDLDFEFLYFDLDVIIQKNIDYFFQYKVNKDISLIKIDWATFDYARSLGINESDKYRWVFNNSSILKVDPSKTKDIWISFNKNRDDIMSTYYGIDGYLWHNWESRCDYFDKGLIYSYLFGAIFPDKQSKHRPEYKVCILDGDVMPEDVPWLSQYL